MYETNYRIIFDFLSKQYPSSNICYIGAGWSSIVFLIDNYIFRFPKQNMVDYEYEMNICRRLYNQTSFEIPIVEIIYDLKYPFVKHKCLEGKVWSTVCANKYPKQLVKDCALFLAQIHNLTPLTKVRQRPVDKPLDMVLVEKKLHKHFKGILLSKLCSVYETGNISVLDDKVLVHGDFQPGNVVLDLRGRLKGVFDWCNSGIGERICDFIHLYNNMDKQFMNALFVEYYHCSGVVIDECQVKRLAVIDLINKLFWADTNIESELFLKSKIEEVMS